MGLGYVRRGGAVVRWCVVVHVLVHVHMCVPVWWPVHVCACLLRGIAQQPSHRKRCVASREQAPGHPQSSLRGPPRRLSRCTRCSAAAPLSCADQTARRASARLLPSPAGGGSGTRDGERTEEGARDGERGGGARGGEVRSLCGTSARVNGTGKHSKTSSATSAATCSAPQRATHSVGTGHAMAWEGGHCVSRQEPRHRRGSGPMGCGVGSHGV
jgi:hypothetical protein